MTELGLVDWGIFCGYLAVIFALGLWFARSQHTNEDFFVGGRRMNWLAVGVSLFATAFSSISFVIYPREAAYQGFQFFVAILFIPLVITPLLWWVFVPFYVRLRVISIYEYLQRRFHHVVRKLGTLLFAGYAIGWMGTMLYASGLILQAVLGLSDAQFVWTLVGVGLFAMLYTILGGVQAVIWTDVLQDFFTLGGGMLLVFFLATGRVEGGLNEVFRLGVEHGRLELLNFDFDLTDRSTFYSACAFGLFMYLPGYTASQITAQRYVCMPSLRAARRALAIHAVVLTLVVLVFFFLGTTLFAYYHQAGGMPDLPKDKQDQILPLFVATELPHVGLTGLLVAGLFAAVMSTVDSGINSLTAVVICDWLPGRPASVRLSRVLCGVFGLSVIAAAMIVPLVAPRVIGMITTIAGTFLGLLLGLFVLGMFFRRANTGGALVGLTAAIVWLTCVLVFTDIKHWWYGAYTFFPTVLIGALASYLFRPPSSEQLKGLLWR